MNHYNVWFIKDFPANFPHKSIDTSPRFIVNAVIQIEPDIAVANRTSYKKITILYLILFTPPVHNSM